jgi:hypothetical protein
MHPETEYVDFSQAPMRAEIQKLNPSDKLNQWHFLEQVTTSRMGAHKNRTRYAAIRMIGVIKC